MKFTNPNTPKENIPAKLRGPHKRWLYFRNTPACDRFWKKVSVKTPDECWIFNGTRRTFGYGDWSPDGNAGKRQATHRLAWIYTHGPIPDGLLVCHKCDNPPCCNPSHLFLGTHKDNSQDMKKKGRDKYRKGEDSPTAKLKEHQVRQIRAEYKPFTVTAQSLATKFGISLGQTHSIIYRRKWRHVV